VAYCTSSKHIYRKFVNFNEFNDFIWVLHINWNKKIISYRFLVPWSRYWKVIYKTRQRISNSKINFSGWLVINKNIARWNPGFLIANQKRKVPSELNFQAVLVEEKERKDYQHERRRQKRRYLYLLYFYFKIKLLIAISTIYHKKRWTGWEYYGFRILSVILNCY